MLPINRFSTITLLLVAAGLGYLTFEILRPFIPAIIWAVVLSIVFYPLYVIIAKYVKVKSVASVLCLVVILVVLLGPVAYLSYILTQELIGLSEHFRNLPSDPLHSLLQHPAVSNIVYKVLRAFHMTEKDLAQTITESVSQAGKQSVGLIRSGLGNAVSTLADFFLMILSIFFFLADGPALLEQFSTLLPFSTRQRERLVKQTRDIVISTIYGGVTIAVIQGVMGGIAFSLLGISSPVVWGLTMCVSSFIPIVGTLIVWGPAVGYLVAQGLYWKAVVLFVVGAGGISSVDTFLRPLLIRGKIKLPTLAIFFSILGGIKVFGFVGFIMGPLVLALFISVLQILRYSDQEAP